MVRCDILRLMLRKNPLVKEEIYHIFSRSIANFHIFNDNTEFSRMMQLLRYYQVDNDLRISDFLELKLVKNVSFDVAFDKLIKGKNRLADIIAYCLMPTHIHLILKQLSDKGVSTYLSNILNGYTRYFNVKHKRKGPLWESEFKNVSVKNNEQLLHLTRYIHLNPVTAHLVEKPENWAFSSYNEYLSQTYKTSAICNFDGTLEIKPSLYRKFVNDQISYQRELAKIKNLIID